MFTIQLNNNSQDKRDLFRTKIAELQRLMLDIESSKPISIDWDLSLINHPNIKEMCVLEFPERNKAIVKFLTRNILMSTSSGAIELPPFVIQLLLRQSKTPSADFMVYDNMFCLGYDNFSAVHPHHIGPHHVCWGNYSGIMHTILENGGDLYPLVDAVVAFARVVNEDDSAGEKYPNWTEGTGTYEGCIYSDDYVYPLPPATVLVEDIECEAEGEKYGEDWLADIMEEEQFGDDEYLDIRDNLVDLLLDVGVEEVTEMAYEEDRDWDCDLDRGFIRDVATTTVDSFGIDWAEMWEHRANTDNIMSYYSFDNLLNAFMEDLQSEVSFQYSRYHELELDTEELNEGLERVEREAEEQERRAEEATEINQPQTEEVA